MTDAAKARQFEEIALPHLDACYNLARWLTRNDHDAQDIAQEAYLRAFKFFDSFHGRDGKSWLLTIVRNTYFTWLKKNGSRSENVPFDEELHRAEDVDASHYSGTAQSNPELILMQQASKQIITKALAQLPVESREIIVLRELEDLSYREIADVADIPIGTVMSRLARARKMLREMLETMNEEATA